jgi:hypothetical protein
LPAVQPQTALLLFIAMTLVTARLEQGANVALEINPALGGQRSFFRFNRRASRRRQKQTAEQASDRRYSQ